MDLVRRMTLPHMRLGHLKDEMDSLFRSAFEDWAMPGTSEIWGPAIDVVGDADKVTLKAELPGMSKDDVEVYLDNGVLTISGEKKQCKCDESTERYYNECRYGRFTRQVRLPEGLDAEKIDAQFADGVLTVTVPKSEKIKPRRIELKS